MAFDMGFNGRGTAGYVTDGAEGVPMLSEAYPHTYTNSNGYSVNAGWTTAGIAGADRASGNDPRLAGINYYPNTPAGNTFRIALDSGSAPGAGTYTVDWAAGDVGYTHPQVIELYDNTTQLIDGTNGGSGITTASGHYVDATLADVTASTSWTGATSSQTFSTTTAFVTIGRSNIGENTTLAHFRLTLQEAPGGDVEQVGLALAGMA